MNKMFFIMILFGVVLVPANLAYASINPNSLLDEEEIPLPDQTKELLSTCPDVWKDFFTRSPEKKQFMDDVTKGLISNTPEFQSLSGSIQSITAHYIHNLDSPCPPEAYAYGTFRSENNNDIHRFVLEFNSVYFRYMVNDMLPQYASSSSVQDEKQNESPVLSPLKQILSGISPQDIVCSEGLHLVLTLSEKPACVKEQSISKLIARGWIDDSKKLSPDIEKIPTDPVLAKKITDATNQFALDFYKHESENENENIFFSSPSISTAFSILYEGARGETADEMQKVFGFPKDDDERRVGFFSFGDTIGQKNDDENTMQMANALWLADGFAPLPEYVDTAKTYYSSSVDSVNFANDQGRLEINDWAKSKTQDRIKELLKPGSTDASTKMVITNAIYFNGAWEHPFDSEDTYEADFAVDSDKTVKVSMMSYPHKMKFNHTSTEQMQMLQIPYKANALSMLIILPHNTDDMQSVEKSLTVENLKLWKSQFYNYGTVIHMPKFTLETEYNLKESLTEMGMPSVFGPADLSGITGSKGLFVSEAVHKAFVDVNEKGTESAAATAINLDESSGRAFKADRPFIFIIQDNETESILFMGRVMDPTA